MCKSSHMPKMHVYMCGKFCVFSTCVVASFNLSKAISVSMGLFSFKTLFQSKTGFGNFSSFSKATDGMPCSWFYLCFSFLLLLLFLSLFLPFLMHVL